MLQERARECYHNLSEEEKNRKHQYVCNQYRNLFIESEPREEENTEKVNKFANNIEIFLKKKKTKRIIMIENNTEVLLKISKIKKLWLGPNPAI